MELVVVAVVAAAMATTRRWQPDGMACSGTTVHCTVVEAAFLEQVEKNLGL